jgi:hypothetical protein
VALTGSGRERLGRIAFCCLSFLVFLALVSTISGFSISDNLARVMILPASTNTELWKREMVIGQNSNRWDRMFLFKSIRGQFSFVMSVRMAFLVCL